MRATRHTIQSMLAFRKRIAGNSHLASVRTCQFSTGTRPTDIGDLLGTQDRNRRICTLFLPPASRDAASAIQLYLLMLKSQPQDVETMSWWRDALNIVYADTKIVNIDQTSPGKHESDRALVVNSLQQARQTFSLKRRWFERTLEAYETNLDNSHQRCATLSDAEKFAENTYVSNLYLTLEACHVRDTGADHAASHIGKALYWLDVISDFQTSIMRKNNQPISRWIPTALLEGKTIGTAGGRIPTTIDSMTGELQVAPEAHVEIADVAYELASRAHGHLMHARELVSQVPQEGRKALLVSYLADSYLESLEEHQWDLLNPKTIPELQSGMSSLKLQYRVFKAAWSNTY